MSIGYLTYAERLCGEISEALGWYRPFYETALDLRALCDRGQLDSELEKRLRGISEMLVDASHELEDAVDAVGDLCNMVDDDDDDDDQVKTVEDERAA